MSNESEYRYFLYENEIVKGPFLLDELLKEKITEKTPVCYEGSEQWYYANAYPEIKEKIFLYNTESINTDTNQFNAEQLLQNDVEESSNPDNEQAPAVSVQNAAPASVNDNSNQSKTTEFPKCVNHPDVESFAICNKCLQDFCEDCLVKSGGKFYCKNCVPKGFLSKIFKKK